jgi:hypothetical protein
MSSIKSKNLLKKRNQPPGPFVWHTREFLESEAWRTAPLNTRRFVERLEIERLAHGRLENGNLICTNRDCQKFGIYSDAIPKARSDAIRRGLVYQTQPGVASLHKRGRKSPRYGLGWVVARTGRHHRATGRAGAQPRHPSRQSLNSEPDGGFKKNGAFQPKPKTKTPNKNRTGGSNKNRASGLNKKVSGNGHSLPTGWKIDKSPCGQVRIMRPEANGKWTTVPIVDDPLIGTEAERAALAELKAWTEK